MEVSPGLLLSLAKNHVTTLELVERDVILIQLPIKIYLDLY